MTRRPPPIGRLSAASAVVALMIGGCGGEDASAPIEPQAEPESSGLLEVAVARSAQTLDPLFAETRGEQLAARQIYEPLVDRLRGPFEQVRVRDGLLVSIRPSAAADDFTARLRGGVRFSNGQLLDADSVIANFERWLELPEGRALLGPLRSVFSPRPGVLRFALTAPDPAFPERLTSPRLGIASPGAVGRARAAGGALEGGAAGTGPFELRELDEQRLLLVKRPAWWGADLGLGPGVDQVEIEQLPGAAERVAALIAGDVQVADGLSRAGRRKAERAPLAAVVSGGGARLGYDLSVRGIESAEAAQPLSDVWLTELR